MTDDEAKALGARALATGLWADAMGLWPEGALDCDGRRIVFATYCDGPIHGYVQAVEVTGAEICIEDDLDGAALGVPDFRDAGTEGCLLERLREAMGAREVYVVRDGGQAAYRDGHPGATPWTVASPFAALAHRPGFHATPAEALVAALEAAPRRVRK